MKVYLPQEGAAYGMLHILIGYENFETSYLVKYNEQKCTKYGDSDKAADNNFCFLKKRMNE